MRNPLWILVGAVIVHEKKTAFLSGGSGDKDISGYKIAVDETQFV
jgi:hypothetical protein